MIRVRTAAAAALVAGAAVVATPGIAGADGAPPPSASYAGGTVVSVGDTAAVRMDYRCTTVVTPGNHLFVAVKQGPDVTPENFSSSTTQLTSFFSTNWSPDSGPNALTCDGRRHLQTVIVKPQPGFPGGDLTNGPAAVQICVFDNITGMNGHEPVGGYAGSITMQHVVALRLPPFLAQLIDVLLYR